MDNALAAGMMHNKRPVTKSRQLATIGIAASLGAAYSNVSALWEGRQSGQLASGLSGTIMLFLYVSLLLTSAAILIVSTWWPRPMQRLGERWKCFAWRLAVVLIILNAWLLLFSPLQGAVTGAWAQFLVALGLSRLLAWFFDPATDRAFGWPELALAMALFLFPRVIQEARIIYPLPAIFYLAILALGGSLLILLSFLYGRLGSALRPQLLAFRMWLGPWQHWLGGLALLAPLVYRYVLGAGGYILYPNIRFLVILVSLALGAYLLTTGRDHLVSFIPASNRLAGWYCYYRLLNCCCW